VSRPRLLRELAEALPVGAAVSVPREWLLELLEGAAPSPVPSNVQAADMTIADLALRFGRHASTIRGWLEKGAFAGAYKLRGREWRIPAASLAAFEDTARRSTGTRVAASKRSPRSKTDLTSWRRVKVS
jgi:hypothetical protein